MKRSIRQLLSWCAAAMVAALICNGALFAYHRPVAWIHRQGGATDSILRPGSTLLHGTEGRGRHNVDQRGYLNLSLPLGSEYTLVVGSSYVQGKEVPAGCRFVDLMNDGLAPDGEMLQVYSVSQDGFYLPAMVRCFPALLAEFPDAGTIILEVSANDFTAAELEASLLQQTPDPAQTGPRLMENAATMDKLVFGIKETFPVLTLGKMQMTAMFPDVKEDGTSESEVSMEAAMDAAVALLRSQFDGRLVVFYHPEVTLLEDGSMAILPDEKAAPLAAACRKSGVEFVDASEAFLKAYEESYSVPCGFSDTAIASGHLNEAGHQICAEVLLAALRGGGEE